MNHEAIENQLPEPTDEDIKGVYFNSSLQFQWRKTFEELNEEQKDDLRKLCKIQRMMKNEQNLRSN